MESNLVIGTSFSCSVSCIGLNDQSFIGPCDLLDNFDMNMTTNSLLLDASCEYCMCICLLLSSAIQFILLTVLLTQTKT
jgi:hypothetical protein